LFEIGTGSLLSSNELATGKIPRISAKSENNGVLGYFSTENLENARNFENFISVNFFGSDGGIFYHAYKASVEMKVHTLKIPNYEFNDKTGNFISSCLKPVLTGFNYGNQLSSSKLKELDFYINLPIKQNNEIDFEFMESFISELEAYHISELEAYLKVTGLENFELTEDEKRALELFNDERVNFNDFKIGTLFKRLNLKNNNKSFDKLKDTSTIQTEEFYLPLVNAKLGSNGIMFYGRGEDFDSAEMTIDIISNGAVATGTVYPQLINVGVLWDAYLLKLKHRDMNRKNIFYLSSSLEKSIKTKFGWENKAVWSKVQNETVVLPIKEQEQIDFDFMETFISAIQKLVIKDVVLFSKQKISITKKLTN